MRQCCNTKCHWVGEDDDCVHPKHWPDDRLCPECHEVTEPMDIDEKPVGRVMDARIHETVFGEKVYSDYILPWYSADVYAAWGVVAAMWAKGWDFGLDWCQGELIGAMFYRGRDGYGENDVHAASARTMPLAVCRAVMKTLAK